MKKFLLFLLSALVLSSVLRAAGPWDAWRKGYNAFEKGVRLKEKGEYQLARAAFQEAMVNYDAVRKARPDWNQRVIQNRISDSKKAIAEIDLLLTSSNLSSATGVSVPEISVTPSADADGRTPHASASARSAEGVVSQAEFDRVALESERFRKRLLDTLVELEDVRRELARNKASTEEIGNLLRERRVSEERYNLLQKRYAELEKQLKKPNSRIGELESKVLELQLSLDLEKKRTAAMESKWKKSDDDALRQAGLFRAANERLSATQAELDKTNTTLAELRRARDAAAETNSGRDLELHQTRLDLRNRDQQLAARQNEIKKLQEQIESLRRGTVSKESVAGSLIDENKKLRDELGELRKEKAAMQTERSAKLTQIRTLQKEILQLRETAQRTGSQQEQSSVEVTALKKDLERERASAKIIRTEIANWRERCRKLENDVKEWSDRSARFEERVKNLTSSNFSAVEAAEREKKRLETEITTLTERFAVLQARGDQLEELRKQADMLRAKEHEMLTELAKKNKSLEDAVQRAAVQQESMQKKIKLLQEKAASNTSQQQLNAVTLRLKEVSANFQALRGENANLKKKLAEAEQLHRNLAAAQNQVGSVASFQKNLTAQQQENQMLREQLMTAQNQLQAVRNQLLARQGSASSPDTPLPDFSAPAPRRAVTGSTKELIAAGMKAEKEDKTALAVWNYETALEIDPVNEDASMRLGMIQLKRQVYDQAEKYLALARSSGRNEPALRIAHAEALNGLKKYGNALEVLSPLLQKEKSPSVELVLSAAAAYLGSGKSAKAEELLRGAVQRNPEAAAPKRELARIMVRTGRCSNEALELYTRSKELGAAPDGELEKALSKLLEERRELNNFMASAAREAEKANDWLSAAWYYRQMLDQEKRSAVLTAHLAFAQLQSKNAAAALETLTLNPPPSATGSLIAALAHYRNGDSARTIEAAKQAMSLNRGQRIELVFPEWQILKTELDNAVAKPDPKMAEAAKALKAVYF